jgi:hypothetical protein
MFFKKADDPIKKIKRIERSDTPTLINWMDATIMGLGKAFDDWRFKDLQYGLNYQNVWQKSR